jgi:hypothetical protein
MTMFITKKDKDLQRIERRLERIETIGEKIIRYLDNMDTYVSPELEKAIKEAARLTKQLDQKVEDQPAKEP